MKKLILLIMVLGLLGLGVQSDAGPPSKIVGLTGECESTNEGCLPFPTQVSFLCDGGGAILDCPQYFAPDWTDTTGLIFYGITNRANPPRCVKSTDGGGTWGLCDAVTIGPFVGAIINANSGFSVASDGSLISSAIQGANTCIIRRSTNGGVSWSTVYTDTTASEVCAYGNASPTPNGIHCSKSSPYCVVVGQTQATNTRRAYYSIDNGANWTKGTGFTLTTGDVNNSFAVTDDGNGGSWSMFGQLYNTATWRFAYTVGGDWTFTDPLPQPGLGTSLRCPAAFIFNGSQAVLCGPDNGVADNTKYRLFTHAAGSVNLLKSPVPQSGLTNAQAADFSAVGYNSVTGYVLGRNAATTLINIWVTRDGFTSLPLLGSFSPTTAVFAGCCRGDMLMHNGKIYVSSGSTGANAFLLVIQ